MIRGLGHLLILTLLGACQSKPEPAADLAALKGGGPAPAEAGREPLLEIDWTALGSCREQLRELLRISDTGGTVDPRGVPFGVVVGPPVERDRLSQPTVPIAADLPIPLNDAAARRAPCLLRVGLPRDVESRRRIVGQDTVESQYQSGVRREDNPAYALAKAKVEMAKRRSRYDDEVWEGVGDPMIDLVGLLVGSIVEGFSEGARQSDLEDAMVELARTPRKIDRPVYVPYHYDRIVVEAARRASIPVELVDRSRGTSWRTTIHQSEQRRFDIPQGISRRDRSYPEQTSQRELKAWLRSPPELRLTRLVGAMLDGRSEERPGRWQAVNEARSADLGSAPPGWPASQPKAGAASGPAGAEPAFGTTMDDDGGGDLVEFDDPAEPPPSAGYARPLAASGRSMLSERQVPETWPGAPSEWASDDGWQSPYAARTSRPRDRQTADLSADPRFSSVVVIKSGKVLGSGFYVRPHLVVTNHHVVQEEDIVDLTNVDGNRVMGMVIANDVGRDLALIHTPQPGPPAPLYDGPELRPGVTVDAIGAPHGYDFTLTRGIVSAVRTRPALLVPSMQQVRYVQTDADINHGNSGGPLFLGDQVVGVNDRVDPKAVSGGLNFAIHVDELRAFLEEEGVARPAVAGPLEDQAGRAGNG